MQCSCILLGETYLLTISCYLLSYILCASSATVDVYAGGAMFYAVGQSGTQILDQIIASQRHGSCYEVSSTNERHQQRVFCSKYGWQGELDVLIVVWLQTNE